jgi:hypothetical protein
VRVRPGILLISYAPVCCRSSDGETITAYHIEDMQSAGFVHVAHLEKALLLLPPLLYCSSA